MDKTIEPKLLFSHLSGHNLYVPSKRDPGLFVHLLSDTEVTVREVFGVDPIQAEKKWRYFVEHPIDIKNVLWPIDIVLLSCGNLGLIFRKRAFPKMEGIKTLLYNTALLTWERPEIRKLAEHFLTVFDQIHTGGYAYHAFDITKIYYNPKTYEVLVDFSLGMTRHLGSISHGETVDSKEISVEFLPPWKVQSKGEDMTLSDDYYAISAMLFRLLLGRMPYQGRLMDGQGDMMDHMRDTDPVEHERMFKVYHENPYFIFDPTDTRNAIGLYTHEEKYVMLWEALPKTVREMFIRTFSAANLTAAPENRELYSPRQWLDALKQGGVI